jgi:uncharacterized protein GlcG (DUF336 family)
MNPFAPQHAAALALGLALAAATTAGQAQAVRTERTVSLALATQLASATVAACSAAGHHVSAAVVDRAGQLRALHRADLAGPHTLEAAQAKAYTSASARNNTLAMMEAHRRTRPRPTWCTSPASCCWAAACR